MSNNFSYIIKIIYKNDIKYGWCIKNSKVQLMKVFFENVSQVQISIV